MRMLYFSGVAHGLRVVVMSDHGPDRISYLVANESGHTDPETTRWVTKKNLAENRHETYMSAMNDYHLRCAAMGVAEQLP